MLRKIAAVALLAWAGTSLACDDAGRGKSASYAPDDGVPDKVVDVRGATPAKETAAAPVTPAVVKKQAEGKRKPQGKPIGS